MYVRNFKFTLQTGDRILEVDGIDVKSASHEQAVDIIRASGNPVKLLIQSLVQWVSCQLYVPLASL